MFRAAYNYVLRDKEGENKGGGGGGGESAEQVAARLLEQARGMVSNKGAEQAIVTLLSENKEYRDKIRDMNARVPKDGSVILSSDEAKEWEAFKGLGKAADVKKLVEEHPTLLAFKTDRENSDQVRDIARRMSWNADVLVDIRNARKLTFELKDVKQKKEGSNETETVKVPYVKVEGGSSTEAVPLADYAKENLGPYMTALSDNGGAGAGSAGGNPRKFPPQQSSDQGSGGGSLVERTLRAQQEARAKATNPLMPAPAATS